MQSSYNLIKNISAEQGNKKVIETKYISNIFEQEDNEYKPSLVEQTKINYEKLGENIVKRAKEKAEQLILQGNNIARELEKGAYEKGYAQGEKNGYEDGYNTGYKYAMEKVLNETKSKVDSDLYSAERILRKANEDYINYLTEKETNIIKLSLEMAKIIAGKEIICNDGILSLIEPVLEETKGEENIIIRCNPSHADDIRSKLDYYKVSYSLIGEIFLLEDSFMEPGNAIVEKKTGKVVVGIDVALEKLLEVLFI